MVTILMHQSHFEDGNWLQLVPEVTIKGTALHLGHNNFGCVVVSSYCFPRVCLLHRSVGIDSLLEQVSSGHSEIFFSHIGFAFALSGEKLFDCSVDAGIV